MSLRLANTLGLKLLHESAVGFLAPISNNVNLEIVRHRRTKHWNPKWKWMRRAKVMKVELPKYNEKMTDLSEEEIRSKLKEQGMLPPRPWIEKEFNITSTGSIFEPYVPPEGDGKVSPITTQGAKQKLEFLEKKSKTMLAIRKIRSFEDDFDTPEFCKHAEDIYIKMHACMAAKDKYTIRDYVTERAYPEVMHNIRNKTIHWKFIKNVELPRVAHARCTNVVTKENIFAQITVRFHTQQTLAIYDRFGRLMHGSEILAKDVLEYVIFEKHISSLYGKWRIHHKIIPDWLPPKEPSVITFRKVEEAPPAKKEVKKIEAVSEVSEDVKKQELVTA